MARTKRRGHLGGSCREGKTCCRIFFTKQKKTILSRTFYYAKFGGKEKALLAAGEFRKEESDRLGLTRKIPLRSYGPLPLEKREYISAFLDGDGSYGFYEGNANCFISSICLAQTQENGKPPILKMIKKLYGGRISSGRPTLVNKETGEKKVCRRAHRLLLHSDQIDNFAQDMLSCAIIKQYQCEVFIDRHKYEDKEYQEFISYELKNLKHEYQEEDFSSEKLTWPYLAGLHDAEGLVKLSTTDLARVDIAQKQCPAILNALQKRFEGSISYIGDVALKWTVSGKRAIEFLEGILPYSIVKKDQIEVVLNYMKKRVEPRYRKDDPERQREFEEVRILLKQLKRK